jgi:hypothetical protein
VVILGCALETSQRIFKIGKSVFEASDDPKQMSSAYEDRAVWVISHFARISNSYLPSACEYVCVGKRLSGKEIMFHC